MVILASAMALVHALPIETLAQPFALWMDGLGAWGLVLYALCYVAATVLLVPGSLPTMLAGALFGLSWGVVTVSIGSTTGATLAFLIARYLAREKVSRFANRHPKFRALDQAVAEGGWKIVALLRLSPAVPFNLQNYLYGLTRIRFVPCLLATWLAMLPGTFLYVYIGHVAGVALAGERERTGAEWAMLIAGLVATVIASIYLALLARRQLRHKPELEGEYPDGTPAFADRQQTETTTRRRPWGAVFSATMAVLLAAAAVTAQLHPKFLQEWLAGLFGPPEVEMREAYEDDPAGRPFDHAPFDRLLNWHVREGGWVDYAGLERDRPELEAYIEALSRVEFPKLGRDEKLALLINAYNAFTLKLILERFPLESIRDIPAAERWEDERWKVGSNTWSLNQIEHEQIRPNFREPRVHFALVCAAIGCPPLRGEAYTGERIEVQLEEQARYVHAHQRWFRFDPGKKRVRLTRLYQWYGGDFEQVAGSVLNHAARYDPGLKQSLAASNDIEIEWLSYDWSLNSVEQKP